MAFIYRTRTKEQWEARASGGGDYESWLKPEYRLYKPASSENCIRILPPLAWEDAPHYGMTVWVHYSVGPDNATVICNFKMSKGNCPICEERVRAERGKDEEKVRRLRPTKRVLVFMLNKKDESQGPLAWGMPQTLDQAITKIAKDRATGEYYFVDHHEEGYDIYFDKDGDALNTKYTGASLAKRPSAVAEQYVAWAAEHSHPDALKWRSYEEVKRLHIGAGRGEAPDEAPVGYSEPEQRRARPTPRSDDAPPRQTQAEDNGRRARHDDHPADNNEAPPWENAEPTEPVAAKPAAPPPTGNGAASGKTRAEQLRALAAIRKIEQ